MLSDWQLMSKKIDNVYLGLGKNVAVLYQNWFWHENDFVEPTTQYKSFSRAHEEALMHYYIEKTVEVSVRLYLLPVCDEPADRLVEKRLCHNNLIYRSAREQRRTRYNNAAATKKNGV